MVLQSISLYIYILLKRDIFSAFFDEEKVQKRNIYFTDFFCNNNVTNQFCLI